MNGWLALAVNKLNAWLLKRFPNAPQAVYVPVAASTGTLTPIVRNVAWLWALRKSSPEQYAQILNATK